MRCVRVLVVAGLLSIGVSPAGGTVIQLAADLDGEHARPPTLEPNHGMATATIDDISGAFAISGASVTGSTVTDIEIRGPIDLPSDPLGPVILPLSFTRLPDIGGSHYTFDGSATFTSVQVADLLAGEYFIAVNTGNSMGPAHSSGGSLQVIPEPSEWGCVVCLGAITFLCGRSRKRTARY